MASLVFASGRTFATRCFFFIFWASLRIQIVACLSIVCLRRKLSALDSKYRHLYTSLKFTNQVLNIWRRIRSFRAFNTKHYALSSLESSFVADFIPLNTVLRSFILRSLIMLVMYWSTSCSPRTPLQRALKQSLRYYLCFLCWNDRILRKLIRNDLKARFCRSWSRILFTSMK